MTVDAMKQFHVLALTDAHAMMEMHVTVKTAVIAYVIAASVHGMW